MKYDIEAVDETPGVCSSFGRFLMSLELVAILDNKSTKTIKYYHLLAKEAMDASVKLFVDQLAELLHLRL